MRDEKEERSKQGQTTNKAKQHMYIHGQMTLSLVLNYTSLVNLDLFISFGVPNEK